MPSRSVTVDQSVTTADQDSAIQPAAAETKPEETRTLAELIAVQSLTPAERKAIEDKAIADFSQKSGLATTVVEALPDELRIPLLSVGDTAGFDALAVLIDQRAARSQESGLDDAITAAVAYWSKLHLLSPDYSLEKESEKGKSYTVKWFCDRFNKSGGDQNFKASFSNLILDKAITDRARFVVEDVETPAGVKRFLHRGLMAKGVKKVGPCYRYMVEDADGLKRSAADWRVAFADKMLLWGKTAVKAEDGLTGWLKHAKDTAPGATVEVSQDGTVETLTEKVDPVKLAMRDAAIAKRAAVYAVRFAERMSTFVAEHGQGPNKAEQVEWMDDIRVWFAQTYILDEVACRAKVNA